MLRKRVPANPTPGLGVIVSEAVIEQAGFWILILCAKTKRIEEGGGAVGEDAFAEGVVVVAGGERAVGGVDQGGDVAITVISRRVGRSAAIDREQAADTAGSLGRTAEIEAPDVGADGSVGGEGVHFSEEIPTIVDKPGFAGDGVGGATPVRHFFRDAPALAVVDEFQFLPGQPGHGGGGQGLQGDEAVFRIPSVKPAAVGGEVAIGIVRKGLGGPGQEGRLRDLGHGVFAGRADEILDARDLERREFGGGGVVHGKLFVEGLTLASGRLRDTAVGGDGHGGRGGGDAGHVDRAGDGAGGVGVEEAGGVGSGLRVGGRGFAVADVVVGIGVGEAEGGGGVGKEFAGGGNLSQCVVSVAPVGVVLAGGAGALVGGVVGVGVTWPWAGTGRGREGVGDLGEAVEFIVGPGGDEARGPGLRVGHGGDERGVGQVAISGGDGAAGDELES